jgi:N-acetyltransferase
MLHDYSISVVTNQVRRNASAIAKQAEIRLAGTFVRLEPLDFRHADALLEAAAFDPAIYRWSFVPTDRREMKRYIQTALRWRAAGTAVPFAIVRAQDGMPVGSTRFFDTARWAWPEGHGDRERAFDTCEIGYTWLGARFVRTAANTEAKLLLLTHAFERWGVWSVCFHTDERNERSRNALVRIGAQFEGILRAHRLASDLTPRNSARYSILRTEWPQTKRRLEERLG